MKKPTCNIRLPHLGFNCACNEEFKHFNGCPQNKIFGDKDKPCTCPLPDKEEKFYPSDGTNVWEEEFRGYFDKCLKPKKTTIKNLDREIIVDFIKKEITKSHNSAIKSCMEESEKNCDSFLLKDWSGESEVYGEIERLKKQVLDSLKKKLR